ncbi:hypothetical protein Tco_0415457 [Tanacetum coccineum]
MLRRPMYVFFTLLNLGKIGLEERIRCIRSNTAYPINWIRHIDSISPKLKTSIRHMALPPQDQRHQYLRYEGLQYTDADIADFETRLARIYKREIHKVQSMFTSRAWRRLFDIRGPLVHELILEFFSNFRFGEVVLDLDTPGSSPIVSTWEESQHLNEKGLMVIAPALPIIDMAEFVRLHLCVELDDTWAWILTGPARQEGGAGGVIEEALIAQGGSDEDEEMPQAGQREVLDSMAHDFSRFSTWTITSLAQMMDMAGVPYTRYSESPVEYERIKSGSKFSTIVREYVTKPSRLSIPIAELRRMSDFKCVKAEEKSNLKTSL